MSGLFASEPARKQAILPIRCLTNSQNYKRNLITAHDHFVASMANYAMEEIGFHRNVCNQYGDDTASIGGRVHKLKSTSLVAVS